MVAADEGVAPAGDRLNTYQVTSSPVSVGKQYLCLRTKDQKGMCYKLYASGVKVLDEISQIGKLIMKIKDVINTEYNFCVINYGTT